ncbi:MAG TPA: CvpA family protein [Clostridia bacterium]|nr:CvpA family protein [Clostridia bacterium]
MNIIDGLILLVLFWGAYKGYRRGLLSSLVGLASVLIGLMVAWQVEPQISLWFEESFQTITKLAHYLAEHLQVSEMSIDLPFLLAHLVLKVGIIILVWFLVAKGLVFLAYLVTKLLGKGFLGNLNKGGGLIFGLFSRLLILVVLIGLINPWLGIASSWEGAGSLILKKMECSLLVPHLNQLFFLLTGGRVDGLIFR